MDKDNIKIGRFQKGFADFYMCAAFGDAKVYLGDGYHIL